MQWNEVDGIDKGIDRDVRAEGRNGPIAGDCLPWSPNRRRFSRNRFRSRIENSGFGTSRGRVVFGWSVNYEIAFLVPVWVTWLALQAVAAFSNSICK